MPSYTAGNSEVKSFLVPAGEYGFRVIEAKEDTSKAGNEMIVLKHRIIRKDGTEAHAIYDRLVFTAACHWRIDAFLNATGRHPGAGQAVDLEADDCLGLTGRFRLKVGNDDKGNGRNEVDTYLSEF